MTESPGAVRILSLNEEDHSHVLNEDALAELLLDSRYADKKVSLISVAGAFRKGKSFILNFFLRYLTWREKMDDTTEWLTSEEKLEGFSWRGGADRDTNGMLIWSRPFLIKDRNGEEIVVLLMDTQGAFDTLSTVKDCATIFALSTMLSSVQIYNISQNLQEDDLQHLQLFTEYGKLALEECKGKPFQQLLFLVRDWACAYDYEYGFRGGERILSKRLDVHEKMHAELRQLREQIRTSFENISCFLMPHPGLKVAQNPFFRGELEDIEEIFQKNLKVLIPCVLDPKNDTIKSINGQNVTCRELLEYFKIYITIFQGENMPEPKSMLQATSEANNLAAVSSAKALYVREMEEVCGGDTPYMNTESLEKENARCSNDAIQQFKDTRKMGGVEMSMKYLEKLDEEMAEQYQYFVRQNNSKNLFKSMRTPAVLVLLMIVDYFLQEVFQFCGLNSIAGIFTSLCCFITLALISWCYVRYSGSGREIGIAIDGAVNWAWENLLQQAVLPAGLAGFQIAAGATSNASKKQK
uniref:GB1/RHD3-type G domain-containing protein n=1 Tax=Panagrolaimus sp. ES5 TaxID=591445 RepID=A0AC34FK79_9BILA